MKKRIYFLGIGGIAMANLACLISRRGYTVSGADSDIFGPSAVLLKENEIKYFENYASKNIKKFKPDLVVVGNAILRGNSELEFVLNNQVPYKSMPELIKDELLLNKKPIVVAGTSGKTTTAALVAWILKESGFRPTALVGGIMKNLGSGFLNGNGDYVVLEGDEYNSSFYDSCPKFLHYRPHIGVVNNVQMDHLDIYGNIENIATAFKKFIKLIPSTGLAVLGQQDKYTPFLLKEAKSKVKTFGRNGNIWSNGTILTPDGLSCIVYSGAKRLGIIKTSLLGKHNVDNILTAILIGLKLKIPFQKIGKAIASFKGVKRRLEVIHQKDNLTIIDDFAHNPEKVTASLSALRSHFPRHQIIAVFEPRTVSSRKKFFQDTYPPSFRSADLVYIAEPFKKEALIPKEIFSHKKLARDLNQKGIRAYAHDTADDILNHLKQNRAAIAKKPTIITVMTSGKFDGIHKKLVSLF